jgi:hypothetical protein
MRALNDPAIDELRDAEGRFFGKAQVQGWLKPIKVEFRHPLLDLLKGSSKFDPWGPTDIAFTMHTPWAAPTPPAGYVKPSRRLFEIFLCLDTASDREIQDFASRVGPLLIFCRPESTTDQATEIIHERSEVWRYFSRCMQALLRIAASVQNGRRPKSSDWDIIGHCPFAVFRAKERVGSTDVLNGLSFLPEETWSAAAHFIRKGEDRDRDMWARLLNVLLELGRARPFIKWQGSSDSMRPGMVFAAPRLLSYLAMQLCLVALSQNGFVLCSTCANQYSPLRAPKAGQRNYCPECRTAGVPDRMAQRARRERLRRTSIGNRPTVVSQPGESLRRPSG